MKKKSDLTPAMLFIRTVCDGDEEIAFAGMHQRNLRICVVAYGIWNSLNYIQHRVK